MNDAGGVRPRKRIGNLDGILQSLVQPHPVPGNQLVERLAGDALHRNEVNALGLADVVYGDDVGMVQRRSRLRFLHEALFAFGVSDLLRGQDFDGDKAVKVSVTGFVDDTHPALTKFFEDAVVRDGSPDHWRESYVPAICKSMKAWELEAARNISYCKIRYCTQ